MLFLCTHVRHDAYTVEWSILGFSPVRQKKKKKKLRMTVRFFPGLPWAGQSKIFLLYYFFCSASPHSATHAIVVVIVGM